jgi:hypothetical protein
MNSLSRTLAPDYFFNVLLTQSAKGYIQGIKRNALKKGNFSCLPELSALRLEELPTDHARIDFGVDCSQSRL